MLVAESQQMAVPIKDDVGAQTPAPSAGPPPETVATFWRAFGSKVPSDAIVLASSTTVEPGMLRNALDRQVGPAAVAGRAFLFFVDLAPEANWAHACAYAFVSLTGATAWCSAEWPPHPSVVLKRQVRP